MASRLPEKFSYLDEFVDKWAVAAESDRLAARLDSPLEEIRAFYEAIIAAAPEVLTYLEAFELSDLNGPDETLLNLLLGLAEVAPAVELFESVVEDGVYDPKKITIVHELIPL